MKTFVYALLAAIILLGIALRIFLFTSSIEHIPTTSDEALAMLIAKGISKGEWPLLFHGTPYQFPLESYLLAPFYQLLPKTAFGARFCHAILACASVLASTYLLSRMFAIRNTVPGLIQLFLPSAYLLTLQAAYFIPQYTTSFLFASLIPLLVLLATSASAPHWRSVLLGAIAGFALSNHLISIPLVASASLVTCLGRCFSDAVKKSVLYCSGLALGLSPYLLTLSEARSDAAEVTGRVSLSEAFERLSDGLLSTNLKVLLGPAGTSFPDFYSFSGTTPFLIQYFLVAFGILLAYVTILRGLQLLHSLRSHHWPRLEVHDLFVCTTWLSLFAFLISRRSGPTEYRYLLPLAWALPFVLSCAYSSLRRAVLRAAFLGILCLLSTVNARTAVAIADVWRQPRFSKDSIDLPPLEPVMNYLEAHGIRHCYSSFWFAYRFTFARDEALFCEQLHNERFHFWPLPSRKTVDDAERAAYVLTNTWLSRFKASGFLGWLRWHRVEATITELPPFFVFHDFHYKNVHRSEPLASDDVQLTSTVAGSSLDQLKDRDLTSSWRSTSAPEPGDFIELRLPQSELVHRLRLYYVPDQLEFQPLFDILVSKDGRNFEPFRSDVEPLADRLFVRDPHPIIHLDARQDISFPPQSLQAVRIVAKSIRSTQPWEFVEMELSRAVDSGKRSLGPGLAR